MQKYEEERKLTVFFHKINILNDERGIFFEFQISPTDKMLRPSSSSSQWNRTKNLKISIIKVKCFLKEFIKVDVRVKNMKIIPVMFYMIFQHIIII